METKTLKRPWTCDDCGITHNHFNDIDHNLRGIIDRRILDKLAFNPRCHCGWIELATMIEEGEIELHGGLARYIMDGAELLPVPEETENEIRTRLNSDWVEQ